MINNTSDSCANSNTSLHTYHIIKRIVSSFHYTIHRTHLLHLIAVTAGYHPCTLQVCTHKFFHKKIATTTTSYLPHHHPQSALNIDLVFMFYFYLFIHIKYPLPNHKYFNDILTSHFHLYSSSSPLEGWIYLILTHFKLAHHFGQQR